MDYPLEIGAYTMNVIQCDPKEMDPISLCEF